MKRKMLFSIAIACLFLCVTTTPTIGINLFDKKIKNSGNSDLYIRMFIVKNGNVNYIEQEISESDFEEIISELEDNGITNTVEELKDAAYNYYLDGGGDIQGLENAAVSISDKINSALPDDSTDVNPRDIVESIPNYDGTGSLGILIPSVVISAGFAKRAYTVSFEDPEAFAGFVFDPMLTNYQTGHSVVLMWPLIRDSPKLKERMGPHNLQTIGFSGIYLNIGKLGFGQDNFVCYAGISLITMLPAE